MDVGGRRDKEDIIHELQKHFKVLFVDQQNTNKYRYLNNALKRYNTKLSKLVTSTGGINTDEKLRGETMAYSELIKNFNKIRDYMRDFYVYGFKSRDDYTKKSARSYDDEKRRIESWLGNYMKFHQTADGKNVFLSIDSRVTRHNPLYKAWKTKSFTDGDITLHFIVMDILSDGQELSLGDIAYQVDKYLSAFGHARVFDASTIRKKLNEYVKEGLLIRRKNGKIMLYRRTEEFEMPSRDILDFFSETAPCGVIGSFLEDKTNDIADHFAFKHHYITSAMDSEVLCMILQAIHEKRNITVVTINRKKDRITETDVVPLRVMISVQSGRQYMMAYAPYFKRITAYRLDNIVTVKNGEVADRFDELRDKLGEMQQHMWGVATDSRSGNRMEHIEFTVQYDDGEQHIPRRLEREKRIGHVEYIDEHTCRFWADVYDASELIPWIRTFICRITDISISNKVLEIQFKEDLQAMYEMYGLKEEE